MKRWQSFNGLHLWLALSLSGCLSIIAIQPGCARENREQVSQIVDSPTLGDFVKKDWQNQKIRQLSELEIPITNAQQLLVQSPTLQTTPAQTIQITGVKTNPTEKGVEVILETTQSTQLQVTNRSTGNNFIVDVAGGQLRLPNGDAFTFRSEKPLVGITEIIVTNIDANTVRLTVVGVAALPTVELYDDNVGLVFGVASQATATQPPQPPQTPQAEEKPATETPSAQQDEPIELVVTGEQDGYRVPNASTATRTDTPLRDIPQSIQVVPRQVLEDRNVRTVSEAVETVSGVVNNIKFYGPNTTNLIIRGVGGFGQAGTFRNGFRDVNLYGLTGVETIEQVEILKGPASVLFGAFEPGGIVNIVTKQPLSDPYYRLAFEAGNYGFYRPIIDLSGPLDTNKNVLYRFIASYQDSNSIRDFVSQNLIEIAPSITLKLGNRTNLNLYYEYLDYSGDPYDSLDLLLSDGRKLPRSRYLGYPDDVYRHTTTQKFGYTLNHKFSDNWQIRNNLSVSLSRTKEQNVSRLNLVDDRSLELVAEKREFSGDVYSGTIDLLGKFNTGSISHQVLVGFDISRREDTFGFVESNLPNLDIFNPNYNIPKPEFAELAVPPYQNTQSYGIYLQDQIALLNNLKLLIGGRFDWVSQEYLFTETPILNNSAFSPRIGLVYQPSQSISLYSSYSQSFNPSFAFRRNPDGRFFEPTKGTQYEAGIKADFLDGKLSTTLAAYQITKSNIITPDPNNSGFFIQVGEQQSRGIELDIAGEILPGLKVVASYAYTDAEVTEDNAFAVGNKLIGVPENQASLWTTYEIQQGNLKGLGFGLGLFYVGTVAGDLDNTFTLEDYLRTDAALYYRRNGFKAGINIRNLFDTDYFSGSDGGRIFIQRGAPFTITGSISWEF